MSMTRRDYNLIAETLRSQLAYHTENDSPSMAAAVEMVADELSRVLKATNSQFNAQRFLDASGVQS